MACVVVPSVNNALTIELNCEKYSKFKLIFSDLNYSKFNISPTLGLKETSPPRNPNHQKLVPMLSPISLKYLILNLLKVFGKNT
jgi:hypothetical protein